MLSEAAFGDAIARERRDGESVVLDLLGEYGVDGSRALIRSLDARLRAAGAAPPAAAGSRRDRSCSRRCARRPSRPRRELAGDDRAAGGQRSQATGAHRGAAGGHARRSRAARARRARGARRPATVGDAARGAQSEARARLEHEVGAAVATLLERYREAYRARKEAELALDFDDLQERACELLERPDIGARGARALRSRARGRVPGHERPAVPAAGRARRARLPARLRGRRLPVHLPLPLRRRRALPRARESAPSCASR